MIIFQVGWQPWFDEPEKQWQKVINILHPMVVIFLIFIGYIIQYAACFRRDRAGEGYVSYIMSMAHPGVGGGGGFLLMKPLLCWWLYLIIIFITTCQLGILYILLIPMKCCFPIWTF